ncbi:MAG TPA: ABC transporter [Eggerthellaceae bacterium]|nr:ABC transporter [Eggerthellaceae bacterium]
MESAIRASGLTRTFFRKGRESARDFNAVEAVDFDVSPGQLVVVTGRSGSGKTTLLNMLGGVLEPSAGTVLLHGRDLYALGDEERSRLRNEHIGIVPQGHTALRNLTVVQNVMLPYLMYRSGDAEPRALELLDTFGIRGLADSYPAELSGGEQKRVAIARALMCEPDIVLADEPTADLDDENTLAVLRQLRAFADAGGAVVVVSHEAGVADFADRGVRMDAGRIV